MKFSARIKEYLGHQFNLPEDQVERMLPEFKRTLSGHMENLERVYHQQCLDDLAKAAHTIKGAFLNLGLTDCAALAMKIEEGAIHKDESMDYGALITDMGVIVDNIINEQ